MTDLQRAIVALDDAAKILDALIVYRERRATRTSEKAKRTVASVVRRFRADLRSAVRDGLKPKSGSILARVRKIVRDGIGDAYVAGLAECGVAFDDMDADDALAIVELTNEQLSHVADFCKAIREARGDKSAERAIMERVELWTASVEAAGEAGKASGCGDELMRFELDPTRADSKESCATCRRLLGKTMRRSEIVKRGLLIAPGNRNYECGCWNCPHIWVPVRRKK